MIKMMSLLSSPLSTPQGSRPPSPDFKVTCLCLSPDGTQAWLGDTNGYILQKNLSGEKTIFSAQESKISCCAFSNDGMQAVTGSINGDLCVWDIKTQQRLHGCKESALISAAVISHDKQIIIYVGYDNFVKVFNSLTLNLRRLPGHTDIISCCAMSTDEKFFVTGSFDCTLRVWDRWNFSSDVFSGGHAAGVQSCAIHRKMTILVSGDDSGYIVIWNRLNKTFTKITGHDQAVIRLEFSRDGMYLLSYSTNAIKLWNLASIAQPIATITCALDSLVACAFMPDSLSIITSSFSGKLQLWDIHELKKRKKVNADIMIREEYIALRQEKNKSPKGHCTIS